MNYKLLFLGIIFLSVLSKLASANCGCGAPSIDMCRCRNKIVRPVPAAPALFLPRKICKTINVPTLRPIGDACNCRQHVVKPEVRNCPTCWQSPCSCEKVDLPEPRISPKCTTCATKKPPVKSPCDDIDDLDEEISRENFDVIDNSNNKVAADPLSIILANAQSARLRNREGNLYHGFPIDPRISLDSLLDPVSEEKLYDVDGDVLELKKKESEESNESNCDADKLKYSDICFGPVNNDDPDFVVKKTCETPEPDPCNVCRKSACTCKPKTKPCNRCQKSKCGCKKSKPHPLSICNLSNEADPDSSEEDCGGIPTTRSPTTTTAGCPCVRTRPAGNPQANLERLLAAIGYK